MYDKCSYTIRKWKSSDNTKTPPNTSITQRLRSDLGRSAWVATVIQLVLLNRLTGFQPSRYKYVGILSSSFVSPMLKKILHKLSKYQSVYHGILQVRFPPKVWHQLPEQGYFRHSMGNWWFNPSTFNPLARIQANNLRRWPLAVSWKFSMWGLR